MMVSLSTNICKTILNLFFMGCLIMIYFWQEFIVLQLWKDYYNFITALHLKVIHIFYCRLKRQHFIQKKTLFCLIPIDTIGSEFEYIQISYISHFCPKIYVLAWYFLSEIFFVVKIHCTSNPGLPFIFTRAIIPKILYDALCNQIMKSTLLSSYEYISCCFVISSDLSTL